MSSLFSELKRRRVFRVGITYAVTAWVLAQVAEFLLENFGAPEWALKSLLVMLALGFPLALALAWAFQITPDGIKIDEGEELAPAIDPSLPLAPDTEPSAPTAKPSIAVLPFVDMSAERDQEYFSDGLAEELLNLLAKIPQLHVASRTSAFSFKNTQASIQDVAEKLNVAHVLEGSVRKAGDQVRITAQLIAAGDGYHLWSESYDRPLNNIFEVQDEIALAVVEVLKVKLLGAAPRVHETDPEAYSYYLQGRHHIESSRSEGLTAAAAAYEASLAIDPDYAPAWAALAEAKMYLAGNSFINLEEGFTSARELVEKALMLDPQLPHAWVTLSRLQSNWDWDWKSAEASLQKAQQLEPDNTGVLYALAELKASKGQTREAVNICQRITMLDPLDQNAYHDQGRLLIELGELDAAEHCYKHLLTINPQHRNAHGFMGRIYLKRGDAERALAETAQMQLPFWRQWGTLIINYGLLNTPESTQELESFIAENKHDSAVQIAQIYGCRGQAEEALDWLEVAYEQRDAGLAQSLLNDSLFSCLYGNPRMEAVAEKIGLLDDYRAKLAQQG